MPGRITKAKDSLYNLYSIILTTSNIKHDPTSEIQKVRVCGTFTSLQAAKAAAHRCLFDAGYEQEWFTTFDTQKSHGEKWTHGDGVIVYAVAPEGDTFVVSIDTTPNKSGWKSNPEDHRVEAALYHLLQTTVYYDKDAAGGARETEILSTFTSYDQARKAAETALLSVEDGIKEEDWAEYDAIPANEKDWEFGENVVVHAVGQSGENILLSVVKEQALESMRIMEAAMRIR